MIINLNSIKIGPRFRQDFGDLRPLMDSIKRYGLLHPIVISADKELICGRRRIEAYAKLGMSEIEANLMSFSPAETAAEAEADENIMRKSFTVEEIAAIDEFYRDKEERASEARMQAGKMNPSESFARGKSASKIAARVGISDRTLEKIRAIKLASSQGAFPSKVWEKVSAGKVKIDKGFNQVKRFQRIKAAEKLASNVVTTFDFDLKLGDLAQVGHTIPDSSIDMIFTDPPYTEGALPLYADLAKLADRVLKPGASLVTYAGHYALFKINDFIKDNSDLEYHWQIIVRHSGSKHRLHGYRVWAHYKPLLWYYKPPGPTMYHDVADLIESQAVSKDGHEWEQSTIEAEHMIEPLTVKGNVVLDPFMGSGTTGETALQLHRRFIGIEIDATHFSWAQNRLAKLIPLPLPAPTPSN